MSTTSVKLLRAASEIVGGNKALADRLGIREAVLSIYLDDLRELPDPLLLAAVDIILDDRHSRARSAEVSRPADSAGASSPGTAADAH